MPLLTKKPPSTLAHRRGYVRGVVSGSSRSGLRPEYLITEAAAALSARVKFHEQRSTTWFPKNSCLCNPEKVSHGPTRPLSHKATSVPKAIRSQLHVRDNGSSTWSSASLVSQHVRQLGLYSRCLRTRPRFSLVRRFQWLRTRSPRQQKVGLKLDRYDKSNQIDQKFETNYLHISRGDYLKLRCNGVTKLMAIHHIVNGWGLDSLTSSFQIWHHTSLTPAWRFYVHLDIDYCLKMWQKRAFTCCNQQNRKTWSVHNFSMRLERSLMAMPIAFMQPDSFQWWAECSVWLTIYPQLTNLVFISHQSLFPII